MKNKKNIIIEILIYICLILILAYPIVKKTNDKNKIDSLSRNIKNYISYMDKKITKKDDGEYYKKPKNFESYKIKLKKEEYLINNGKIVKGSFCRYGYQINYFFPDVYIVNKGCYDSSKKIEETSIKIKIYNMNECTKSKRIKVSYNKIKGANLEYKMVDNNNQVIIDWTEVADEFDIKENGILYVRLNNKFKSGKEEKINIKNIDNKSLDKNSPIIKKIEGNKVFLENSITNNIEDSICKLDKDTIKYGYSNSKNGKYIYIKDSTFEVDLNKTYYFKTKAKDTAGNGFVESKPIEMDKNKKCYINIENSEILTREKKIIITSKEKKDIYFRVDNNEWKKYEDSFILEQPSVVYCKVDENISSIPVKNIDSEKPSKPQVKIYKINLKNQKTKYVEGNEIVTNENVIYKLNSEDNDEINHYEYSHDKINWNYLSKKKYYLINWQGGWWYYFRSVDNAGNISDISDVVKINIKR